MKPFRRKGPAIVASFDVNEVTLLRTLVRDIDAMLAPGPAEGPEGAGDPADDPPGQEPLDPLHAIVGLPAGPGPEHPSDPVLARLLPDAYGDDDEAASDFRRFTESELRETKRGALAVLAASLPAAAGKVRLTEEQAEAWLAALNDIRLALGVQLGVAEEWYLELERLSPTSPRGRRLLIYDVLTHWQSSLLAAVTGYDD